MKAFQRPGSPANVPRRTGGSPGRAGGNPNFHQLLSEGIALQRQGELWRAQECYRAILDRDPNHPDALHMMAYISLEAMRIGPAVDMLKRALARKPADPGLLGTYAEALLRSNTPIAAERALRKALKLAPFHPELLCVLARCLAMLGQEDEARRTFESVLERDPRYASALTGYGDLLLQLGRRDEASALYRRALDLKSDAVTVMALAGLADCRRYKGNPPELAEIKAMLRRPGLRAWPTVRLGEAAAKICNDIGEYDEAFQYYLSNKKLLGSDYDGAAYAERYRAMKSVFTPEFFAARRGYGSPSNIPVFIVGMPRSGTTLTEQIIASHPQAVGAGELGTARKVAVALGYGGGDEREFARRVNALTAKQAATHARDVLDGLTRFSASAARITDKMPHNFEVLGLIALLLPRAKIIHCRRNPLDTCVSCFTMPLNDGHDYARDLTTLGEYYREYIALMEHWRQALPMSILDLDYEAMVADSEEQSRRVIAFLDLEWDPACLNFHSTERAVQTFSRGQVRQPIYNSSIGRWRRYEKHLGPLRAALGDLAD